MQKDHLRPLDAPIRCFVNALDLVVSARLFAGNRPPLITSSGGVVVTADCQLSRPGQVCPMVCASEHEGNPIALCSESGEWVYSGRCEALGCNPVDVPPTHPSPFALQDGMCTGASGSECEFACGPGYVGNPVAVCDSGQWRYTGSCAAVSCGIPDHPSQTLIQVDPQL